MLSRWLRVFIGFLQCQYPPWFSKGLFWFWFATIAWRSLESRFFDVLFFVTSSECFCYYYIMWCLFGIPLKLLSNELGLRRVIVLDFVETPSSQSTHSETKLRRLIRHRSSLSSLLYILWVLCCIQIRPFDRNWLDIGIFQGPVFGKSRYVFAPGEP